MVVLSNLACDLAVHIRCDVIIDVGEHLIMIGDRDDNSVDLLRKS